MCYFFTFVLASSKKVFDFDGGECPADGLLSCNSDSRITDWNCVADVILHVQPRRNNISPVQAKFYRQKFSTKNKYCGNSRMVTMDVGIYRNQLYTSRRKSKFLGFFKLSRIDVEILNLKKAKKCSSYIFKKNIFWDFFWLLTSHNQYILFTIYLI